MCFVIDHMGILQPTAPPPAPQPWADLPKVVELAKCKNAVFKVGGACTLSKAWGFDGCLLGAVTGRASAVVNYEQALEPFLKTDRLSGGQLCLFTIVDDVLSIRQLRSQFRCSQGGCTSSS